MDKKYKDNDERLLYLFITYDVDEIVMTENRPQGHNKISIRTSMSLRTSS